MFYIDWVEQFWQDFWKENGPRIEQLRKSDVDSLASDRRVFLELALRNLRADVESMSALNWWMLRFGQQYPDLRAIWSRQLADEQKAISAMDEKLQDIGGDVWNYELNEFFKNGWKMLCEVQDLKEIIGFGVIFEREHYLHHVHLGKAAVMNGDLERGVPYMEILAPDEYRHCTMVYSYMLAKYFNQPRQKEEVIEKLKQFADFLIQDAENYSRTLQEKLSA